VPSGATPTYDFTQTAPISNANIYSIAFNSAGVLCGMDGAARWAASRQRQYLFENISGYFMA
jgi:hypothetical protein